MKITKLGLNILDKTIQANEKAYFSLQKTYERVKKYNKVLRPSLEEQANKCWLDCKGNCAPFRYGIVNNDLCKICPGNHNM